MYNFKRKRKEKLVFNLMQHYVEMLGRNHVYYCVASLCF